MKINLPLLFILFYFNFILRYFTLLYFILRYAILFYFILGVLAIAIKHPKTVFYFILFYFIAIERTALPSVC